VPERKIHIAASNETILVAVRFRIRGKLRFLSHAEMLKLFQRASARAGVKIRYSQGFNPRPRLSLPLPRTVGVESDDDLLCIKVETSPQLSDIERLKTGLSDQLPDGCQLLRVEMVQAKTSFQPSAAAYVFPVKPQCLDLTLKSRIRRLLENKNLNIERRTDAKGNIRTVDVRPFLKSIELDNKNILVQCKISSAGSIRIEEILKLLELTIENLTAPIRRESVQYQTN
jgi:radical SAM-linked protein